MKNTWWMLNMSWSPTYKFVFRSCCLSDINVSPCIYKSAHFAAVSCSWLRVHSQWSRTTVHLKRTEIMFTPSRIRKIYSKTMATLLQINFKTHFLPSQFWPCCRFYAYRAYREKTPANAGEDVNLWHANSNNLWSTLVEDRFFFF